MESETFKMRKQFLGDFFDNDRVKFLNTIKKDILIHKKFKRWDHNNQYIFRTSLTFLNLKIFKIMCKFIKPFTYFLYSFTYHTNFIKNKILHFEKLDIKYGKQIYNIEETVDKDIVFTIYNMLPQPYEIEEDSHFLKSIKIDDCLNETVKDVLYIKLKIKTTYLDVKAEDYLSLRGEFVDLRLDLPIRTNNETPPIKLNGSETFKFNECVICLTKPPNALFCNCGHLCLCSECNRIKISNKCPICKTENTIIRTLE